MERKLGHWQITLLIGSVSVKMRMLRYCLGISLEKNRTNKGIREEANVMNILDMMKRQRLQPFGHVCRREREEDIKKLCELRVERSKNRGRPNHRWKDIQERCLILFPQWRGCSGQDKMEKSNWTGPLAGTRYPNRTEHLPSKPPNRIPFGVIPRCGA